MRSLLMVGGMLMALAAVAAPRGGMFIPRNGGYEGRLGAAHVFVDQGAGGALSLASGEWPALQTLARCALVFAAQAQGDNAAVEVRQEFDRSPEIIFLEEGGQRLGLRVKFKLFDRAQRYFGHGMTETWLYPNGEIFLTAAATFENARLRPKVLEGAVELALAPDYAPTLQDIADRPIALGDKALADRVVSFQRQGDNRAMPEGLALYWRTWRMAHNTFIFRNAGEAPTYFRWPDYFRQAYGTGAYPKEIAYANHRLSMRWPAEGQTAFNALFRLAPATEAQAKQLVAAEEPVTLAVQGGVVHGNLGGYNDQEGAYEVRKTADPLTITLPADPRGRTVRVKAVGLTAPGAVTATLDGAPLVPQLVAEGGIADDPLAPIREQPEGCADMALVTVPLGAQPRTLVIRETDGVQYTYLTRDPQRNVAVFSTKGGGRYAGFRFSLVDGHARFMRAYGRAEHALGTNLLTWFSYCGYTPEQVLSELRDFEVLKNGPDEAIFRYVSANAGDGAQSEYLVRVPADSPAMRMDVTATFTVLEGWPYDGSQFFDVFPFRGVWPRDWWYRQTLWLAPGGQWKTRETVKGTIEGDKALSAFQGGGFFALYPSDRGNMVMLVKPPQPDLPVDYVICGNYIDFHMTMKFLDEHGRPKPPAKGFQAVARYELAVWGDETATREQLLDIGKRSLAAGTLMLP